MASKPRLDRVKELERIRVLSAHENSYFEQGYKYIAGVDECGRGCLAGPVAAAAVILPRDCVIEGVRDSKKLTENRREVLFQEITEKALAVGFALVDSNVVDDINILQASLRAMGAAILDLPIKPEIVLVDGRFLPNIHSEAKMESLLKGDDNCFSIAAASIVAKVRRDRLMRRFAQDYPVYGFEKNKGYGTASHYRAIAEYGLCPLHRLTFRLYK